MNVKELSDFQFPIKLCSGKIALETLPSELRVYGARKPLVLFSVEAMIKGLQDIFVQAFNETEMVLGVYDSVPEIPSLKIIKELSDIYIKNGHDAIIAVGSGSVMHIAKVVNIAVSGNKRPLKELSGKNNIRHPLNPFFVVPTASGSGLMANGAAMVEDLFFSSRYLIPNYVVLDPRMITGEETEVVADISLRALTTVSEAYTLPEPNYFMDPYCYLAIQSISENLIETLKNKDAGGNWVDYLILSDLEKGRLALTASAILAGFTSFYIPKGIVERLGEAMSRVCGVSEGLCMGILLPYGLEYNRVKNSYRTDQLLLALKGSDAYARLSEGKRSMAAMNEIQQLLNDLFDMTSGRIPRSLENLSLSDEKLLKIAEIASEGERQFSKDDCLQVLKHAVSGTSVNLN